MNLVLKPELERFVAEQVKAGRFPSRADVLEAGLARLMLDPPPGYDLDDADLAAIDASEKEIARGEDMDWREVSAKLRREFLGK